MKMHWQMVTKTIVTLKKIIVTKDNCYALPLENRTLHTTTQKQDINEVLEERSKGKPFERKRSERHVNFVFRMK